MSPSASARRVKLRCTTIIILLRANLPPALSAALLVISERTRAVHVQMQRFDTLISTDAASDPPSCACSLIIIFFSSPLHVSLPPGTSLSAEKLLKIVKDLDEPPDTSAGGSTKERSSDSASDGNSSSPGRSRQRSKMETDEEGEAGGSTKKKSRDMEKKGAAAGKEAGASSRSGGVGLSGSFARDAPPERPKISLDISDDSDSDEDVDDDSD